MLCAEVHPRGCPRPAASWALGLPVSSGERRKGRPLGLGACPEPCGASRLGRVGADAACVLGGPPVPDHKLRLRHAAWSADPPLEVDRMAEDARLVRVAMDEGWDLLVADRRDASGSAAAGRALRPAPGSSEAEAGVAATAAPFDRYAAEFA